MFSWYSINVPDPGLSESILQEVNLKSFHISELDPTSFSESLRAWIKARHLVLRQAILFVRDQAHDSAIHIDISASNHRGPAGAINFELSGKGKMLFFEPLTDPDIDSSGEKGQYHVQWKRANVKLIDACTFEDGPKLVRTDVPHKATITDSSRVLVSLRFSLDNDPFPSWEKLVNHLKDDLESR